MITSAINTAVAGLQAAEQRLNVSANNVANQSSTLSRVNGETVQTPYQAQEVQQQSLATGGVRSEVHTKEPATVSYFAPDNAAANEEGITEFPNVNLEEEVIQQQLASYDFKANLKVLEAADEMMEETVNIIA